GHALSAAESAPTCSHRAPAALLSQVPPSQNCHSCRPPLDSAKCQAAQAADGFFIALFRYACEVARHAAEGLCQRAFVERHRLAEIKGFNGRAIVARNLVCD